MSETQWLKPAPGRLVRFEDPSRGHIPAEGAEAPMTKYYRRRIADRDLEKARRPAAARNAADRNDGGAAAASKPAKEG